MEGETKREQEEWIGGGEEVPGSAFFLTEDAQPSVRRQTHVWPSFVQHLTWCEGFSLAMPTCVADDVCVSSVPWLLAWSCRAMLFTSSVPQAALQGGWGIRCKMASDTQHNQGVPAWILYSAFHHSHPLWTDQSRWMRWIRILIECLGAVIKKNDYIFPKCMKKWTDHWGAASCFGLIHIKYTAYVWLCFKWHWNYNKHNVFLWSLQYSYIQCCLMLSYVSVSKVCVAAEHVRPVPSLPFITARI